ncbi:MAG: ferredoxin-thioredoxin reductase catalytic domain-containing protein, partial [Christensenellaceae bacterium]
LLNSDEELVMDLMDGLLTNLKRYELASCPCRLLRGKKQENLDIVCPCVYRDEDLAEYGACFCALYISPQAAAQKKIDKQIPDRRKLKK